MSIPIDVVFLRREKGSDRWRIISAHADVPAWRALPLRDGKASETLELPAGTIQRCGLAAGDELCID